MKFEHQEIETDKILTPKFSEDTRVFMGYLEGVLCVGLHSEEETFALPLSLFMAMSEAVADYTEPSEGETIQ